MFNDIQHLVALYDSSKPSGRYLTGWTGGYDPEEMGTIYDSGNACPLDGCEPSGLMTNTYNQASMGPHDRMAEGVSGWKNPTYHMTPEGMGAWTKNYGDNYFTSGI